MCLVVLFIGMVFFTLCGSLLMCFSICLPFHCLFTFPIFHFQLRLLFCSFVFCFFLFFQTLNYIFFFGPLFVPLAVFFLFLCLLLLKENLFPFCILKIFSCLALTHRSHSHRMFKHESWKLTSTGKKMSWNTVIIAKKTKIKWIGECSPQRMQKEDF